MVEYSFWTAARARELRRNQTPAEKAMWELLRKRRFRGLRFLRQKVVGNTGDTIHYSRFILDFYCPSQQLIVEVDGGVHHAQIEYDRLRDETLRDASYVVVHVWNDEVLHHPLQALSRIAQALEARAKDAR